MIKIKDGQNIKLSSLQKKILARISLPLVKGCPSSLRYELAKFDSQDVAEAYDEIYALYEQGLLHNS